MECTVSYSIMYASLTREKKQAGVTEDLIDSVLMTITPRERRVLQMRYGLDTDRKMTLEEVGREFGISGERVRQIQAKALRKLRHPTRSKQLRYLLSYMDELSEPSQVFLKSFFGSDWEQFRQISGT